MTLMENEHHELYNPEDFEGPRHMKLNHGPKKRRRKRKPPEQPGARTCGHCHKPLPESFPRNRLYCDEACRQAENNARRSKRKMGRG